MQSQATLKRHAALVDQMAKARGLDLEEQMLQGKLDFGALEDSVLRCTTCTNPDGCEQWLAAQSETAPETPSYCQNAPLFKQLEKG